MTAILGVELIVKARGAYLSINSSVQTARVLVPSCAQRSDTTEDTYVAFQILDLIVQLAVLLNCVSVLACHVLQIIHLATTSQLVQALMRSPLKQQESGLAVHSQSHVAWQLGSAFNGLAIGYDTLTPVAGPCATKYALHVSCAASCQGDQ